jgi:hypothetical protein
LTFQSENPAGFSRQKSDADGLLDTLKFYCMWYKKRMRTRDQRDYQIEPPYSFLKKKQKILVNLT